MESTCLWKETGQEAFCWRLLAWTMLIISRLSEFQGSAFQQASTRTHHCRMGINSYTYNLLNIHHLLQRKTIKLVSQSQAIHHCFSVVGYILKFTHNVFLCLKMWETQSNEKNLTSSRVFFFLCNNLTWVPCF